MGLVPPPIPNIPRWNQYNWVSITLEMTKCGLRISANLFPIRKEAWRVHIASATVWIVITQSGTVFTHLKRLDETEFCTKTLSSAKHFNLQFITANSHLSSTIDSKYIYKFHTQQPAGVQVIELTDHTQNASSVSNIRIWQGRVGSAWTKSVLKR